MHVETAQRDTIASHCYGVKRQCPLTDRLQYVNVLSGYPPDLQHDHFESTVPLELALCLNVLIRGKCFTLDELN